MADNIFEELEPRTISADEMHALLAALKEENNALKRQAKKEEDTPGNAHGGEPVLHNLHLTDGRVIANHPGIGTHYSETLTDGSTKVTRVREHYPVDEIDPTLAYA